MATEKKIIFSAESRNLLSFLDKTLEKINAFNNSFLNNSAKISENQKNQLKNINDQVAAMDQLISRLRIRNGLDGRGSSGIGGNLQTGNIMLPNSVSASDRERIFNQNRQEREGDNFEDIESLGTETNNLLQQILDVNIEQLSALREGFMIESSTAGREAQSDINTQNIEEKEKEKEKSGFLKDLVAFEGVKQVIQGASRFAGGLARGQDEDAFIGTALSGIPGVGPALQTLVERRFDSERKLLESRIGLSTATGVSSIGSNTKFGLSGAENQELALQVARAGGNARDLKRRTNDITGLSFGFNLDQSTLFEQEKLSRVTGGSGGQNVATLINALTARGLTAGNDFSQLEELLQIQNQLTQTLIQTSSTANQKQISNFLGNLQSLGGQFNDPQVAGRVAGQINQSLTNPQTDFQRSLNLSALASTKGMQGASLFELLEAQEQGINNEGFLGARLGQLQDLFGGGDAFKLAIKESFGLNFKDAGKIAEGFQSDPDIFSRQTEDSESLRQLISGQQKRAPEGRLVATQTETAAMIEDAFSRGALEGLGEVLDTGVAKLFREFGVDVGLNISDEIENGFVKGIERAKKVMSGEIGMYDIIKENILKSN